MYSKVVIVLALAAFAATNDIHQRTNNTHGLKHFFKGHYAARRATTDIFVITSGIISAINVTDLRDSKDGEATIVGGGVGHNNVTISLKSPSMLRGYHFFVEVYSDEKIHKVRREFNKLVTPQVAVKPTNEPVTGSTGKPSTELATAGTTFATSGNPEVTITPTTGKSDVTVGTVTLSAGKPEVTKPAEVTGESKMYMKVPESKMHY